jgi:hypothetical protein
MPVRTPRCRPRLEALEARWTPAGGSTVFWTSPTDGDWNVSENWSTGQVPTAADDVIIGSGVVVTSGGNLNAAQSLVCDGGLVVSGGLLALGQPSTVSDLTVSGGFFQATNGVAVTDSFTWTGGQLVGTGAELFGVASISGGADKTLNGFTLDNHADLVWSGGEISSDGGVINNLPDGEFRVAGGTFTDAPLTNAGRLIVSAPGVVQFSSIDTSGDVVLQSGFIQAATFVQTAGLTQFQGVPLEVELVELQSGALTGFGSIYGSLESHGRVAPSGGNLFVLGDYDQASDGVLTLFVGDTAAPQMGEGDPPPSAPLVVYGQATLAGTLVARLAPGVQPAAGDVYEGLIAAPRQGQFEVVDVWSDDQSGLRLTVVYGDTSVDLLVEQFGTPSVPLPPSDPPADPPQVPPAPPADSTPALLPGPRRNVSTKSDPTLANAEQLALAGRPTALSGSAGAGEAAPGEPAGSTPGSGRGVPQGPPQGPQNGGGGGRPGGEQGGRPADPGLQPGGRLPAIGGPMGGKKGAADQTESAGLADELFATFPLALPEIELPSANELLSTADVAAALVVGVRPRANLVPQQSGSQLSGVATLVVSEDGGEQEADVSPFAGLFISPLPGSTGSPVSADALSRAEPAGEAPVPQDEAPRRPVAIAVAATLAAGAAGTAALGGRLKRRTGLRGLWR